MGAFCPSKSEPDSFRKPGGEVEPFNPGGRSNREIHKIRENNSSGNAGAVHCLAWLPDIRDVREPNGPSIPTRYLKSCSRTAIFQVKVIERPYYEKRIQQALDRNPIALLIGPRQCGKTTLARRFAPAESENYFDLEDPATFALMDHPKTALSALRGTVVIDEAQRQPGIFPVLRVLADREGVPARFLVLGSASPELTRQASESLAGRVEIIEMRGFDLSETGAESLDRLWLRGGFPRAFLAATDADAAQWLKDFVQTFLERDLAQLGFAMSPPVLHRFWTMLSHYHGQIWNGAEIAASMGIAPNTARRYLDVLTQTFMVRQLQPWHENLGKRLVKTPKIYLRDCGLFHRLQGITTRAHLQTHPKLGVSWEGFALEETLRALQPDQAYFYAVHSGSELDLLLIRDGRRLGIEFKRADSPSVTRSMRISGLDLQLDELFIIYPGERSFRLEQGIQAIPLRQIHSLST